MTITILAIQFVLFFGGIALIFVASGILHLTEQSKFQFVMSSKTSRIVVGGLGVFSTLIGFFWFIGSNPDLFDQQTSTEYDLGMPVDLSIFRVQTQTLDELDKTLGVSNACGEDVQTIETTNVDLVSERDQEGFTNPIQSIQYRWVQPITDKPLNGIIARICIEPQQGDEEDKIFCHYFTEYELDSSEITVYTSSDKYIPLNKWNYLVWDFTGTIWSYDKPWKDDWSKLSDKLDSEGHWFSSVARRLGEQIFYNAVQSSESGGDATWKERVKAIGIKCDVSASDVYTSGRNPKFQGDFYLGEVWVQPIDYPGSP